MEGRPLVAYVGSRDVLLEKTFVEGPVKVMEVGCVDAGCAVGGAEDIQRF